MGHVKNSPANLASLGGSVIAAVITPVLFIGETKAGDYPHSKSAEAIDVETHQNSGEQAEVEA